MDHQDVLRFWFEEITPKAWYTKDLAFDAQLSERFGELHHAASHGELFAWRETHEGRLAEIILLDQVSRNIHRDTPKAFAQDAMALTLAQEAVRAGTLEHLNSQDKRAFVLMPYMHSESRVVHTEALRLFTALGHGPTLEYEVKHKAIVDRFGRYPHRNAILGRDSSEEELAFLKEPGSSF